MRAFLWNLLVVTIGAGVFVLTIAGVICVAWFAGWIAHTLTGFMMAGVCTFLFVLGVVFLAAVKTAEEG